MRGAGLRALHLVSAWAHRSGIVAGQRKVDDKSNEITAIPQLLEDLYLAGAIVTMDAMGTQTKIAQKIIDRSADHVLAATKVIIPTKVLNILATTIRLCLPNIACYRA